MATPFAKLAADICFGQGSSERFARGECPMCGAAEAASTITDELSRKEFHISGLCQKCQDLTFKEE